MVAQRGGAIKHNSGILEYNTNALRRPDLLKGRTPRSFNMNQLGKVLWKQIRLFALFLFTDEPGRCRAGSEQSQTGLVREDLFTVVHDLFLTETVAYADIVLPATSAFENTDFYTSYWHHYIQLQQPVIERYGESKSNTEVFRLLAEAMGFTDQELKDSDEELIRQALDHPDNPYLAEIDYDSLTKHSFMKAKRKKPLFPGKLPTPSGKIELYSEK